MKYKGLETSFPLLCSYEALALDYKKRNSPQTYDPSWRTPGSTVFEQVDQASRWTVCKSLFLFLLRKSNPQSPT